MSIDLRKIINDKVIGDRVCNRFVVLRDMDEARTAAGLRNTVTLVFNVK